MSTYEWGVDGEIILDKFGLLFDGGNVVICDGKIGL